jgi:alpha-amylase
MDETLQTGLPAGEYCDLITDCKKKITVDGSGNAHIVIDNNEEPILAFIVGELFILNLKSKIYEVCIIL